MCGWTTEEARGDEPGSEAQQSQGRREDVDGQSFEAVLESSTMASESSPSARQGGQVTLRHVCCSEQWPATSIIMVLLRSSCMRCAAIRARLQMSASPWSKPWLSRTTTSKRYGDDVPSIRIPFFQYAFKTLIVSIRNVN